jgi:hypothetical protein
VARVYFWIPKTLFGWCCAVVAGAAIGVGLLFILVGPNWANAHYDTTGSRDAFIIAALAAIAGGTYLGATLERPRRLAEKLAENTREVDALVGRLRTLPLSTWDDLAAAYAAAARTRWVDQSAEIFRNVFDFGAGDGERKARHAHMTRAAGKAIDVARVASAASLGAPATAEGVTQARIHAAVSMAMAVAAKPFLTDQGLAFLWRPFDQLLPLGSVTGSAAY